MADGVFVLLERHKAALRSYVQALTKADAAKVEAVVEAVAAATAVFGVTTTPGTAGNIIEAELWSELVPYSRIYTPDERIYVPISGFLCLSIVSAPAAVNLSGVVFFEEL
jgi:hypothetical protein